jgi:hypothetical protein
MYDPTLHIDGLVVCSLLRNAKNDYNFVPLAASTMQKEVAKELPAVISGCNIASALFTYTAYCVRRYVVIHQGRLTWLQGSVLDSLPRSHVVSLAAENRYSAEAQPPPSLTNAHFRFRGAWTQNSETCFLHQLTSPVAPTLFARCQILVGNCIEAMAFNILDRALKASHGIFVEP